MESRPRSGALLAAAQEALKQPRYRLRAPAIAAEMATYDAAGTGADLLETLARSKQPALGLAQARSAPAITANA